MDFDVTIQAPDAAGSGPESEAQAQAESNSNLDSDTDSDAAKGEWRVTIRAYHQLGPCRSPDDWRWARFSESSRPHLFFPNRPNRRGSSEFPGAARKRWFDKGGSDPDPEPQSQPQPLQQPQLQPQPRRSLASADSLRISPPRDTKTPRQLTLEPVEIEFRQIQWASNDDDQDDAADDDMADDAQGHPPQLRLGTIMESVPLGSPSVSPTNSEMLWQPPPSTTASTASTAPESTLQSPVTASASPVAVPPWLWTQLSFPNEWGVF